MKKFLTTLMVLLLSLSFASTALASINVGSMIGVYPQAQDGKMKVFFQLREESGSFAAPDDTVSFTLNDTSLRPITNYSSSDGIAYVILVDCSVYYQGTNASTASQVLNGLIGGMRTQDSVAMVQMTSSDVTTSGQFMSKDSALGVVQQLSWAANRGNVAFADISAPLWEGIDMALKVAHANQPNISDQKVIVVITDAVNSRDSQNGYTYESVLGSLDGNTPVFCAALFHNTRSTSSIRSAAQTGREQLASIAGASGGAFYAVDESSEHASSDAQNVVSQVLNYVQNIYTVSLDLVGVPNPGNNENNLRMAAGPDSRVSVVKRVTLDWSRVPTPTPEPVTATPSPLKYIWEDSSADIYNIQQKLKELYYYTEDDYSLAFDTPTIRAILDFCKANNLTEYSDGISNETYELLMNGNPLPKATPTPTPVVTRDPGKALEWNDDNRAVICQVQDKLQSLFYWEYDENSYGVLDNATQRAINLFCTDHGLATTSGMSKEAYELLMNGDPAPRPTATSLPTATRDPGMVLLWDAQDNDISTVCQIQDRLEELGYWVRDNQAYGTFDQSTLAAINQFCDNNGLPRSNGMRQEAFALLTSDKAIPRPTEEEAAEVTLSLGDTGTLVNAYQQRLKELNYLDDEYTPGVYDEATQHAQDRLCEVNNIVREDGASPYLQEQVFSQAIQPNQERKLLERIRLTLLGQTNLFGFHLPTWILVVFAAVLVCAALAAAMLLLRSTAKKKEQSGPSDPSTGSRGKNDKPIPMMPNIPLDSTITIDANTYVPATIDGNTFNITIRIDYNGTSMDKAYTLSVGRPLIVGRSTDADILLNKDDHHASRHHGELCYRDNSLYFQDNSTGGTKVDNTVLHNQECKLHNGSTLRIGEHRLTIQM